MGKKNNNRLKNHYYGDDPIRNVAEEFLDAVKGFRVLCLEMCLVDFTGRNNERIHFVLKKGYTRSHFREIVNKMAHCWYDPGYGIKYLYGTIWLSDGSWYERWEDDGSEGWDGKSCPEISKELL